MRPHLLILIATSLLIACEQERASTPTTTQAPAAAEPQRDAAPAAAAATTASNKQAPSAAAAAGVLVPQLTSFEALRDEHARSASTPEQALRLWLLATVQYTSQDAAERERGKQGLSYLTIPFKDQPNWERAPSNRFFTDRLTSKPYIFYSYAKGTSPQNGYALNIASFEPNIARSQPDSHGRGHMLAVQSSGADSARPVYLKKSDQSGLWFVSEFNNLYVDIRPPVDPNKETFR
jgi:hypothetical protein